MPCLFNGEMNSNGIWIDLSKDVELCDASSDNTLKRKILLRHKDEIATASTDD